MKQIIFIIATLFLITLTYPTFSEDEHECPNNGTWEKNILYKTYPGTNCIIKIEWCCYRDEDGIAHYSEIHFSEAEENIIKHCMGNIDPFDLY